MLSKMYSQAYRENTIQKIKDFNNTNINDRHRHRIGVICFLNHIGYNASEIANIIKHYNPSLLNDTGREKYCNEYYIQDVLSYKNGNKKKEKKTFTEKERSSFSINPLRSNGNICLKSSNVDARYSLIPDNDKNKSFFKGALIIAYSYIDKKTQLEKLNQFGSMDKYTPKEIPYFRSIAGEDHVLFVCDLDKSNFNNSLDETRKYADELRKKMDFDIFKFSGSEGYHLIKYMPKETTIQDLYNLALSLDPNKNKLDWHMFQTLDWKIRGYCVNWKTGLMSCDVILE